MSTSQHDPLSSLERRSKRIENLKNRFEIAAIIAAGVWALFTFIIKDAPAQNKEFTGNDEMRIDSFDVASYKSDTSLRDKCMLNYHIKLKNVGTNTLRIDSVYTTIWSLPLKKVDSLDYLDFNSVISGDWKVDKYDTIRSLVHFNNSLVGLYPPEAEATEDFSYIIPINKEKAILVAYNAFGHGKILLVIKDTFAVRGYSWKYPCVPDKETPKKE